MKIKDYKNKIDEIQEINFRISKVITKNIN